MKKQITWLLCIVLMLSLAGCGTEDEVELQASQVQDIILNYFSTDGLNDSNFAGCEVDDEKNVVIVRLRDISGEMQEEFVHIVFSSRTGSTYVKYLKEHKVLVFEKER
ncbi:MAG: hypothetical protein K6E30_11195 [Lachnospiraceae bacterium]|nr:hypothetical protein [Lachnospiraceae bacterium]